MAELSGKKQSNESDSEYLAAAKLQIPDRQLGRLLELVDVISFSSYSITSDDISFIRETYDIVRSGIGSSLPLLKRFVFTVIYCY